MPDHFRRQPQNDFRKRDQDRDRDQMRNEVRERSLEDLADRTPRITRDDKAIQADRWRELLTGVGKADAPRLTRSCGFSVIKGD